ncbi:hypothetical protein RFI_29616 [Reticulomyxa filosa]|uniref:Uncharacterized protein n=1 Tax=Reticulomyxa filosa TaxID=46433 RepID=X6M1L0_RETFI|nr:hypothetical protein RFI_29616 [Reticulomyxa filosa]|eukprot:ETO07774.1 hypothetical protein RFI_29616 [Reticulomyxa filosa]
MFTFCVSFIFECLIHYFVEFIQFFKNNVKQKYICDNYKMTMQIICMILISLTFIHQNFCHANIFFIEKLFCVFLSTIISINDFIELLFSKKKNFKKKKCDTQILKCVFDLNTFQFIKHRILSIIITLYQSQKIDKKKINKIIKCYCFVERQNYQLNMIKITTFFNFINYMFVMILHHSFFIYMCINNVILFFGRTDNGVLKSVYKYLIRENKWMIFLKHFA